MPVEFTASTEDLKRAARQLEVNRGEFNETDIADLVVSPSGLEIRAVGTETCEIVIAKQPGAARLPLKLFVKIVYMAQTYHERQITISLDDKCARVGRSKISHPDIAVGGVFSQPPSLPIDASALDTLAVAYTMTPEQIANTGLRDRVENARKRASAAIDVALDSLKEFNVTSTDLKQVIDRRVVEASEVLRKVLKN